MKKLIAIAITLLSLGIFTASAEARTPSARASAPQIRIRIGQERHRGRNDRRWNDQRFNHRPRTVIQYRTVDTRRGLMRETYEITYWPNGRTTTRLISRERVRR